MFHGITSLSPIGLHSWTIVRVYSHGQGRPDIPAVDDCFQWSRDAWERAHVSLQRPIQHLELQTNCQRWPQPPYQPGQMVWLSKQNIKLKLSSRKLSPWFIGAIKYYATSTRLLLTIAVPLSQPPSTNPLCSPSTNDPKDSPPQPLDIDGTPAYIIYSIVDSYHSWLHRLQWLNDSLIGVWPRGAMLFKCGWHPGPLSPKSFI